MSKFYLFKHLCEFHVLYYERGLRKGQAEDGKNLASMLADLNECLQTKIQKRNGKRRKMKQQRNKRAFDNSVKIKHA